ncbi:hypothetical protein N9A04_00805 [Rickettsiales bacterium]|nr:hypothetical protein [Rickettsiales bacterium]
MLVARYYPNKTNKANKANKANKINKANKGIPYLNGIILGFK